MRAVGFLLSLFAVIQFSFGNFLNNVVIEYDKPTSVRGAEMTTLGGGGLRFRISGDNNIALFNITPPSLKVGCSGIDLSLGALGLLNFEQFGRLIEALMGSAGVMFAFNLALSALCPQCQNILNELGAIANQLNQMQISQCGAVAMAGALGKKLGREINNKITGGQEDNFNKALQNITSSINSLKTTVRNALSQLCGNEDCGLGLMVDGGCVMDKVAVQLSYLQNLFGTAYKSDYTVADVDSTQKVAGVLRYYFGDLCFPKNNEAKGLPTEDVYIKPLGGPQDFVRDVLGFAENGQVSNYCDQLFIADAIFVNQQNSFNGYVVVNSTLCEYANSVVQDIINKIRQRQPLGVDQIDLLSSIPMPIYKLLNYGSVYNGFLDAIGEQLRKYIMMELAVSILGHIARNALIYASTYKVGTSGENEQQTSASQGFRNLIESVSQVSKDLEPTRREYVKELRDAIHSYEIADRIYTSMFANMAYSPIYGNLVFSRLLGMRF